MGGAYSPDGRRIAFCLTEGPNTDVWVMNADGSGAEAAHHATPAIDVSPGLVARRQAHRLHLRPGRHARSSTS